MNKFFDKILNFFFPKGLKCIFCGNDIPHFNESPYCEECAKDNIFNDAPKRCKICDTPIYSESEYCDGCRKNSKAFDKAVAPFVYEGKVRSMVLRFKNDNAKYLANPMAKLMADKLIKENIEFDIIVPVPLSEKSFKKRKYNQSLLLAEQLSLILNKPLNSEVLTKIKETKHQKELTYDQRQRNLTGAFQINNSSEIKNKKILLVDDILTTCATANHLSMLLKKHAASVNVIAFARTVYLNKR